MRSLFRTQVTGKHGILISEKNPRVENLKNVLKEEQALC